jgi:thioester reductase-like protein
VLREGFNVFVTGATGLIGGEFVRTLITRPVGKVWALVRPIRGQDPAQRIADRLDRSAQGAPSDADRPVSSVCGDVSHEHLGLDEPTHAEIRRDVDVIVHSAAETSFIRSAACRRTNIAGAKNLIEFVRTCDRQPLLVCVSTAYVSGAVAHTCMAEQDGCRPDNDHYNEYTHSKAVAEELFRSSGLPVLVVRPSVVLSAGLTDPAFARAILWFCPLLNHFDAVPIDPVARPDVVPVQFVVDCVIRLLEVQRRRYDCYHISAGRDGAVDYGHLSTILDQHYERATPLQLYAPSQWTKDLHRRNVRTPEQRRLFATLRKLLPFLNMDVLYDNSRLREELGDAFPELPPLSEYLGELVSLVSEPAERASRPPAEVV